MEKLATRYAIALYDLSLEEKVEELILKDIKNIQSIFELENDLSKILKLSQISKEDKKAILADLFSFSHPYVLNTLKLMVDKHRASHILEMCKSYRSLYAQKHNIIEGIAYTAIKLSDEELRNIELELSEKEQQTIVLINRVDPKLIKGIKIRFADKVIDASLQARIENLRQVLREERA
jgi:F-type H+-transporting ATPase subunit delta